MPPRRPVSSVLKVQKRKVRDLRISPNNEREHSPSQIAAIRASIEAFGFNDPIAVDADAEVIEGAGRLTAAREMGMDEVPTITLAHLSPAQRDAYRVAHNKIPALATWDTAKLLATINAIAAQDIPSALIGFSEDDIARMADDASAALLAGAGAPNPDEERNGTSREANQHGSEYDYVPFNVILTKEQREQVYVIIGKAKRKYGVSKTDEAIISIFTDWERENP